MKIITVSIFASLATVTYSFMKRRKQNKVLKQLLSENEYQKFDQNKRLLMTVGVLILITAIISYYAFQEAAETGWALLIFLGSALVSEPLINRNANIFYYNETSCILNEKVVPFRSIKEIKTTGLPIMKQSEIRTLSNDKYKVDSVVANLIEDQIAKRPKKKK